MERLSQLSCKVIIFTCLLYCCVDGFSIGRSKLGRSIEKRYGENGFDALATLENLSSGYQFISKFLKNTPDGDQAASRTSSSGFGVSGVPNCDDCFMGLRVSRREASVVSLGYHNARMRHQKYQYILHNSIIEFQFIDF